MARREPGWIAVFVPATALCVAVLLLVFRDPVLRSLELPVAYLVWFARIAVAVLGQRIPWAVLVVIAAVSGLAALRTRAPRRQRLGLAARREVARTRVSFWENALSRDQGSWLSRQLLAADLRRLALRVLEHTEGAEQAAMLEAGEESVGADLPACIRELFQREGPNPPGRIPLLARLLRRRRRRGEPRDDHDVAEIVNALERRLNVSGQPRREG